MQKILSDLSLESKKGKSSESNSEDDTKADHVGGLTVFKRLKTMTKFIAEGGGGGEWKRGGISGGNQGSDSFKPGCQSNGQLEVSQTALAPIFPRQSCHCSSLLLNCW